MNDKDIFALAALVTVIVVTLYAITDYKVVQPKSDAVTPGDLPEKFHWFAERVTTPPEPSPLDMGYALLVECFTFIKGKLPTSFRLFLGQVADKVSATYVELVGVLAE